MHSTFRQAYVLTTTVTLWARLLYVHGSRGARVNIFEQPPRFNRGAGDIANLWTVLDGENWQRNGLEMRNALKPNSPNRWTRYINSQGQYVIPYIFGDASEHATIARAMLAISQNTCIRFQRRAGETDYVELKNERGEGCYTTVGRVKGKNVVMLETNSVSTCIEFDIVIHELMHTIGLWHEQMRYDRDDYIKIHYENIAPAYYTQFEKIPETDSTIYGVKYDYESVMHYAKDAFASAPGKITMETLNKDFQDVIGKMKDASPGDYLKICNIYSCGTCMGRPFIPIASQRNMTNFSDTDELDKALNNAGFLGHFLDPQPLPKLDFEKSMLAKIGKVTGKPTSAGSLISARIAMARPTMAIISSSSAVLSRQFYSASPFSLTSSLLDGNLMSSEPVSFVLRKRRRA